MNQECARCGWSEYPGVLQVHHRDRDTSNNAIDNLETLCPTCHQVEHLLAHDGPFLPEKPKGVRQTLIRADGTRVVRYKQEADFEAGDYWSAITHHKAREFHHREMARGFFARYHARFTFTKGDA